MRTNPAAQVRLIDFLCGMTAPSVVLRKFALLEVITELSNGQDTGIRWSAIGVEFRDQPHYGAPRSIFIRVLLDCADNLLVVKTLAVKPGLRPAKLPDVRAFFATVSLHTSTLHPSLLRRRCGVEEYSGTEPKGRGAGETGRVNCFAAAKFDNIRLADDSLRV
jgi:hypothetical protein